VPKRALTAASVERIKPPPGGQVDCFDKGFPGLALRVSYGGSKTFVFFYRVNGKLRRLTLGTFPAMSLAGAREAWRSAREDVQLGRDPALTRKRDQPATGFESVAREWLRRDQAKNKSHGEVERIVNRELVPAWGYRSIADITRRDILDLIDGIADRGAVIAARRVQAYVHRLFKWAVGRGIIEANPVAALPKPGSETKRDRVLSNDELVAVWKAAKDLGWPFGPAIQLLILTGARREEVGGLRWSEIVDGQICLSGERTKNAEPHTIPLSAPALTIIESLPRIAGCNLVFTTNSRTSISGWSRAKATMDEALALPPWRIHDLRRTVATGLQKLGVSLQVIEAVLGHISGSRAGVVGVHQRHSFESEKRAAMEAWGAHVVALVEGRGLGKVFPMRGKQPK
jgi:integrase